MITKLSCLVLAVAACQSASAREAPPQQRFEHDMMVRFHMHENFGLLRAIEMLLVHGKLDDARSLARAIAIAPDESGSDVVAKRVAIVRERAEALVTAQTVDEACRREARLAAACADCHVDSGVLPEFANPPAVPPDLDTVKARMARHRWATDRLWEGVVGDNDETWRAGLDVLSATPLPWGRISTEREALAHRLQQLADGARKTQATDQLRDRAAAYGEILVTCAACHTTR